MQRQPDVLSGRRWPTCWTYDSRDVGWLCHPTSLESYDSSEDSILRRYQHVLLLCTMLVLVACAGPGTSTITTSITQISDTPIPEPTGSGATVVALSSPSPLAPSSPTLTPLHGRTTITFEDNLQTLELAIGDTFLLALGGSNNWEVRVGDEQIIARVPDPAVEAHAQERYKAIAAGQTYVQATGVPDCVVGSPGCPTPKRSFHLTIVVEAK